MRKTILAVAVLGGILAGCSQDADQAKQADLRVAQSPRLSSQAIDVPANRQVSTIASLPDRGSLAAYDQASEAVHRGAATWHPVKLSEQYALRSIAKGGMTLAAPNGAPISLKYLRHIEHPDGNWTWIGRPVGDANAAEAILTFGKDAVYGSIPNGVGEPLQVTTSAGKTWMVETDPRLAAMQPASSDSDFLMAPDPSSIRAALVKTASSPRSAAEPSMAAAASIASNATGSQVATVDLVIGYTTGFATRLGGPSEALTRLNFMVDVANQAYSNSEVAGQLRLVRAVQLNYPDNTANRAALFELSGTQCTTANGTGKLHLPDREVNCTSQAVPAALKPLLDAREQSRADVAALVRAFQSPENQTCGVAWVLGGGQQAVTANNARFALSVISDSSGGQFPDPDNNATCRNETLAHEIGHTFGLAHDQVEAAGGDDTNGDGNPLDPEEYGRFADSFGYSAPVNAGNFYTIMSIRSGTQTSVRVFSNPRISTCAGFPCGVAGQSDNAGTLVRMMPLVATFRGVPATSAWFRGDFNGDGQSDIVWRDTSTGRNAIWLSGNAATQQPLTAVTSLDWKIAGVGDFNGDHRSDILWRNTRDARNTIWLSGNSATQQSAAPVGGAWTVSGVADFNGDGRSDILWHNPVDGRNVIWLSGNPATPQAVATLSSVAWAVAGVGDFDGDGKDDILWRNASTGANAIWKSGNAATSQGVATVTSQAWIVGAVGDFDGDGKADIVWRNISSGADTIWKSASSATPQAMTAVTSQAWVVIGAGDFDNDGKADVLWHNIATGANAIWKSADFGTQQAVAGVSNLTWIIAG